MTKQHARDITKNIAKGGLWLLLQLFTMLGTVLGAIGSALLIAFRHAPQETTEEPQDFYYSPGTAHIPFAREIEKGLVIEADEGRF